MAVIIAFIITRLNEVKILIYGSITMYFSIIIAQEFIFTFWYSLQRCRLLV